AKQQYAFVAREGPAFDGSRHIQWTGEPTQPDSTGRNAVLVGENALDRDHCGTGTCERMVQWYAKGKLRPGEAFVHESYIGSRFVGKIEDTATVAGKPAIIPSVEGWARITGYNTIFIDDNDPYKEGFQVI